MPKSTYHLMDKKTYWKPIALYTAIKLGFPDFKDLYNKPLFIRVKKDGTIDKREILAMGCEELPDDAEIILEDFVIVLK